MQVFSRALEKLCGPEVDTLVVTALHDFRQL
jgi:hypothetical protein